MAPGTIGFELVGPKLSAKVIAIPYQRASLKDKVVRGNIPILDPQYGNVWTNVHQDLLRRANIALGDYLCVSFFEGKKLPYLASFSEVAIGEPSVYVNGLLNLSVALNQHNFTVQNTIASGSNWRVEIE